MPDQNPFQVPLQKLQLAVERMKPVLVDAIGVEALKFIDDNFEKQGFQGAAFEPWPKLKKAPKGKPRKILVDSTDLRRSPVKNDHGDHTVISTDIPYAQIHNEGGEIVHGARAVILSFRNKKGSKQARFTTAKKAKYQQKAVIGAHTTKMPKRQFIGESPVLTRNCQKVIITLVTPVLNRL